MEALEMERPMDSWNDERLDEMSRRMDTGFKAVDKRFENVATREQVTETRQQVADLGNRLERFEGRIQERMDRLYWAFIVLAIMLAGNLLANSA